MLWCHQGAMVVVVPNTAVPLHDVFFSTATHSLQQYAKTAINDTIGIFIACFLPGTRILEYIIM